MSSILPVRVTHFAFCDFLGVGIATMVMVTYYNVYYCVIVAWSLYYFVASFVAIPDLPWNTCGTLESILVVYVFYPKTLQYRWLVELGGLFHPF